MIGELKSKYDKLFDLLSGKDVWNTLEIPELGIESISMSDGPHGIRKQMNAQDNLGIHSSLKATLFPSNATLACTFNSALAYETGKAIGAEARSMDVQVVLGPGINIKRNPLCGRNFEYYSEDPLLSGVLAANWIKGVQSQNVGTSLKHFAANNQETRRFSVDSVVDERALREIYLRNFQIALLAEPTTVMCSYNKLNGTLVSENKHLLTDILRGEFGFEGLIVSDWGAVSNRVKALKAGLDLEMPSSYGYGAEKLREAYKNKEITEEEILASANHIKSLVNKYKNNEIIPVDLEVSHRMASEIANEGIVLLKNDEVLPLKPKEKVMIVGEFAANPRVQGGGSSNVNTHRMETVLSEIGSYTKNFKYFQGYSLKNEGKTVDERLLIDVINNASDYDKIIIMAGLPNEYENEGSDRTNFDLPFNQLKLIEAVSRINKNSIVSLYIGSQVALPFINQVKGLVNCHLLGQASARPLLDILYGYVNPSGKLATTYPISIHDDPSTRNFGKNNNASYYEESIYIGYRYYSTYKVDVNYPFGYGLSYTKFEYSNFVIDNKKITKNGMINASVKIKNIGAVAGKEVVQLYVENSKSEVHKPLRELRNFQKVYLEANEEKVVFFSLGYNDFSYYDVTMNAFHVNKGSYKIQICSDANTVLLEEMVVKEKNEEGYTSPLKNSYNITTNDFKGMFSLELPEKNLKRRRPYSMDDVLVDVSKTLVGKIMKRRVIREIKKTFKKEGSSVIKTNIDIALKTPLRVLATFSGGTIKLSQMEGIVDLLNNKFVKGIRKL